MLEVLGVECYLVSRDRGVLVWHGVRGNGFSVCVVLDGLYVVSYSLHGEIVASGHAETLDDAASACAAAEYAYAVRGGQ